MYEAHYSDTSIVVFSVTVYANSTNGRVPGIARTRNVVEGPEVHIL